MIVGFDPTNPDEQRSLCKQWTQGSPPVFAVLDGLGTFQGVNQLCITQGGPHADALPVVDHDELDGSRRARTCGGRGPTTRRSWPPRWTGASAPADSGHGTKVGVVVSDEESDQDALHALPAAGPEEGRRRPPGGDDHGGRGGDGHDRLRCHARRRTAQGGRASNRSFRSCRRTPSPPTSAPRRRRTTSPSSLLSDYQSEIEVALGLIPIPYEKALNGQEGVTAETLGGIDLPIPEAQGGYDPGVRSCWTVWHKAYPQTPKGNINDDIEEQGPVQGWCQEIRLFAKAATMAGKDLNRRTFVEAMSHITNFPGGYSPVLSYGPESSPVRRSTRWSRCTTTTRRRRNASVGHPRRRRPVFVGSRCRSGSPCRDAALRRWRPGSDEPAVSVAGGGGSAASWWSRSCGTFAGSRTTMRTGSTAGGGPAVRP